MINKCVSKTDKYRLISIFSRSYPKSYNITVFPIHQHPGWQNCNRSNVADKHIK